MLMEQIESMTHPRLKRCLIVVHALCHHDCLSGEGTGKGMNPESLSMKTLLKSTARALMVSGMYEANTTGGASLAQMMAALSWV